MKQNLLKAAFVLSLTCVPFTSIFAQQLIFLDYKPVVGEAPNQLAAIPNYNVGSGKELYARLHTGKSLAEELKKLAPGIEGDSAIKSGNYQFRFLIDGKQVYQEDLHPGMILAEDKMISKPLDILLISSSRSGLWSINLWDRFMMNGGSELLGTTVKTLGLEIRSYYNQDKRIYSELLLSANLRLTRIAAPVDPVKIRPQVIAAASGWPLSDEKYKRKLIEQLNTKIEDKTYRKINAIVVIKKGKLLLEEYFNGENRASLHDPRSVTKSFTGTLLGMAIHDRYIQSAQQRLGEFYDLGNYQHPSALKDSVRLENLLTMSAAFDGNDDVTASPGNEENMYPTPDYVKFALDLPMDNKKQNGKQWAYFTVGTMLLGDVMDMKIPGGLEQYAKNKLFKPLGIDSLQWARTPQGKPFTGGGLRLRALDFAKYGQLYMNNGAWKGKQIVPRSWVARSFTHLQRLPGGRQDYYGYLFWNKSLLVNGKMHEVYYSSGNGGNKIYVIKDLDLVVVITASAYGTSYAHLQADQILEKYLLPAVL